MPTYAAPGVYVEEVVSTQKVLTSAPTAIAAFVGFTEKAPNDDPNDPEGLAPRLVTSWTQFENLYGSFTAGAVLPLSVYGYFANGGTLAYIVRMPNTAPSGEAVPSRTARRRPRARPAARRREPRARRRHHRAGRHRGHRRGRPEPVQPHGACTPVSRSSRTTT